MIGHFKRTMAFSTAVLLSASTFAQEEEPASIADLRKQIEELRANQEALIDDASDAQIGFRTVDTEFSHNGMGAAASKVYTTKSPLSIGGYGDMYYAKPDSGDGISDVYRFVPYIGYKFSDNIILNTEIEFEHGGANPEKEDPEGYAVVEFMYLDFLIDQAFNVQLGQLLVPMGLINLRHEPTLYNTVQKPAAETLVIPSTWNATGLVAYGTIGETGLSYNAGLIQALDLDNEATGTPDFMHEVSGSAGGKSAFNKAAFVGRMDYRGIDGLLVGGSLYYGDATQGSVSEAAALLYDLHLAYEKRGFKLKALYTALTVFNAENLAQANTAKNEATQDANGYYLNLEYDLLSAFATTHKLPIFAQYNYVNPGATVVDPFGATRATDVGEAATTTVGLNYFPHEQFVLKMDYAMTDAKAAGERDYDTFSLGLGFIF